MNNKIRISIGIPAYNERNNIEFLILNLLRQNQEKIFISKIIVVSDGSNDDTIKIVKKIKNKKICLISSHLRKGLPYRLNQIKKLASTDILVILNADIEPVNRNFIFNLVKPIISNNADLTSGVAIPLKPKNRFEKIIYTGEKFKWNIFKTYKNGNNIFTCRGTSRAFSKKSYKTIKFPNFSGDDAYSYLFCINTDHKYVLVKKAKAFFKLPSNIYDYLKQSLRFVNSKRYLNKYFEIHFINNNYFLPKKFYLKNINKALRNDFGDFLCYLALIGLSRICSIFSGYKKFTSGAWETATSTKQLKESYKFKYFQNG